MSQDSASNDAKRTPIRLEELDGWVRALPDPDEDLPDDLDVRLAASVTEWFRCRPHLRLRCAYPIQKCGRSIELPAIFDERPGADPVPDVVDVALTDSVGVEQFARAGFGHVRPANLFGLEASVVAELGSLPALERDIGVLFVGNCQPAVQRERLQWLGQLAALSKRWNIVIRSGVCGPDYWKLPKQAKIVFNRSIRGECNRHVFEAAAAGSLLLLEGENREVASVLQAGSEYAADDTGNLEAAIKHYLTHDDERQATTQAAGRRVNEFTFRALWQRALSALEWEQMRERPGSALGGKRERPN